MCGEKNLSALIRVKRKRRVKNSPSEKPRLKNIEQTSQNGFYVEMKRIADKERSHQSNLESPQNRTDDCAVFSCKK